MNKNITDQDILVVGSLAYDNVSTPAGKKSKSLGGSANYFSLAAKMFIPVKIVGVIGNDYADKDLALLTSHNIDTSGIIKSDGKTFHWEGEYRDDLNEALTIKTELNVFEKFDPVLPDHYKNIKHIFLANIDPELQLKVLDQIENPVLVAADSMNFWIQSKKNALIDVLKRINILFINEMEAKQLTSTKNIIRATKELSKLGPECIVVKKGEYGFLLYHKKFNFFIYPAFPVEEVIDPTGAGDSFAGGFLGYLIQNHDVNSWQNLKKACLYGSVMASFAVENFGADHLSKINENEILERLGHYISFSLVESN